MGHSLNDLLDIIRKVTGKELVIKYSEQRKYDVHEIYLDINKAKDELDWLPRVSLEDGINYAWNFIKSISNK